MPITDELPTELITTYLEMKGPAEFKPAHTHDSAIRIEMMTTPDVEFYLFLYRSVGEVWRWRDRLQLDKDALYAVLERPQTRVYVLYADGVPGGYIELEQQENMIEVAYFGLRAGFMGRGFGKHLLSFGVQKAWDAGTQRVWVHTCNLDGPHALANYQKRGFSIYDVVTEPMPGRYR